MLPRALNLKAQHLPTPPLEALELGGEVALGYYNQLPLALGLSEAQRLGNRLFQTPLTLNLRTLLKSFLPIPTALQGLTPRQPQGLLSEDPLNSLPLNALDPKYLEFSNQPQISLASLVSLVSLASLVSQFSLVSLVSLANPVKVASLAQLEKLSYRLET